MKKYKAKQKKSLLTKILIIAGTALLVVVVAGVSTVFGLWGNEIASICSIKKIDNADPSTNAGPVYEMNISGGYYFDKFIENGGASSDDQLIDFIVDNISKGILPISIKSPTIGCSSFTAINEKGERLFGRNYDFSKTTSMIVHANPGNGRHKSISSVDLEFLGITDGTELTSIMQKALCLAAPYAPLDGINDAGVSCGIYMSYQGDSNGTVVATDQDTSKPDLTSTTMLRLILDYADNVEEAISLVEQYDLHDSATTSFHYMVADKTGASAIFEWVANDSKTDTDGSKRELKIYRNDDDAILGEKEGANDFQYITNFIVTPNYYTSDEEKKGLDRYDQIESMINPDGTNTEGKITNEEAMNILKMVGRRNWNSLEGSQDSNSITVWSTLYNLTTLESTFVPNEKFDNPSSIFKYKL